MSNEQFYDYVLLSWLAGTRFSDVMFELIHRFDFEPSQKQIKEGARLYKYQCEQMIAFIPATFKRSDNA